MRKRFITPFMLLVTMGICLTANAQTYNADYYNVNQSSGKGIRFWGGNSWTVTMGTSSDYKLGSVNNASIKMASTNLSTGNGWTWGVAGSIPVAALNNQGIFQLASKIYMNPVSSKVGIGTVSPHESLDIASGNLEMRTGNIYVRQGTMLLGEGAGTSFTSIGKGSLSLYYASPYTQLKTSMSPGNLTLTDGQFLLEDKDQSGNSYPKLKATINQVDINIPTVMDIVTSSPNPQSGTRLKVYGSIGKAIHTIASSGGYGVGYSGVFEGGKFLITRDASSNSATDFIINENGYVSIGTNDIYGITTSDPYKLSINGKVACKELRVDADWADFVFENDYDLPEIGEVEEYIKENKHLPGIPNEETVETEGLHVGEMQSLMMQKIEELTLYVIQLKNENDELKAKFEKFEATK